MSLIESTATELLAQLESGRTTAVEIAEACLKQIDRHDDKVKAWEILRRSV